MENNTIWVQRQGHLKAYVSVVNNQYRYEIYDDAYHKPHQHGNLIAGGDAATLEAAKEKVFAFFNNTTSNRGSTS